MKARLWLPPLLVVLALLGLWQLAASSGFLADALGLEEFLVPSPSQIADVLWQDRSLIFDNAGTTLVEIVAGFGLALVCGLAVGVAFRSSDLVRRAGYPLVVASQTIPVIVIAPVLVVWFGYGIWPKLLIIALICFFPIAVNTLDGLRRTDPVAVKMMRSLDASRMGIFRRVEAPTALLPLWMFVYRYGDKPFHVYVNGATGEVQGERPYSWVKILALVFTILALFGGVALLASAR